MQGGCVRIGCLELWPLWWVLTTCLQGVDVKHARVATHYIPSKHLPELQQALVGLGAAASDPAQGVRPSCRRLRGPFLTAPALALPWALAFTPGCWPAC